MCFIRLITEDCVICKTFNMCFICLMADNFCNAVYYSLIHAIDRNLPICEVN